MIADRLDDSLARLQNAADGHGMWIWHRHGGESGEALSLAQRGAVRALRAVADAAERGRAAIAVLRARGRDADLGGLLPFEWMYRFESKRLHRAVGRARRAFYTGKALTCLALGLRSGFLDGDCHMDFAVWAVSQGYFGDDWMELAVGDGVFKNWWIDIYSNSSS